MRHAGLTPPRDEFRTVFVCTGNRARSPLAAALYERYAAGVPTIATSYGTTDVRGAGVLPQALAAAAALGVDLSAHRARVLRRGDLSEADLVVTFEPFHVPLAVIEGGAAAERTFLLGELVRLLQAEGGLGDVARVREAVAAADAGRVRSRPDASAAITDPLGRPAAVMASVADQIDELVRALVQRLFGASAQRAGASAHRQ